MFVIYLILLGWIVLWKLETPWVGADRAIKLVPFVATASSGASAPGEVMANLLLFVPFGVYLGLLAQSRRWWNTTWVCTGASLALEGSQYVLGVGRSDATDVIVNTLGGLAGLAALAVARRALRERTRGVMSVVCAIGTVLLLVGTVSYLLSPIHLSYVRDVGPLRPVNVHTVR
jgi:glycopeptide antibiotics resistance protein